MNLNFSSKHIGVTCVLLASVLWGLEPVLGKNAALTAASSIQTTTLRTLIALVVSLIYVRFRGLSLSVSSRTLSALIFNGVSSGVIADLIYFSAVSLVPVVNSSILSHMQPLVIVLLGSVILQHEKLSKADLLGIACMIVASIAVTTRTFDNLLAFQFGAFGDFLILGAMFMWALSTIVVKRRGTVAPGAVIATYRFAVALVVFLPWLFLRGEFAFPTIPQFSLGLTTGVGLILYYEGLGRLKAAQVSSLELTATFFAAVLGYLMLGESVTAFQVAGVIGIVAGVTLLSLHETPKVETGAA